MSAHPAPPRSANPSPQAATHTSANPAAPCPRAAERNRCAAILQHPMASANMPAAMELALNTNLPATEAVELLGRLVSGKRY